MEQGSLIIKDVKHARNEILNVFVCRDQFLIAGLVSTKSDKTCYSLRPFIVVAAL